MGLDMYNYTLGVRGGLSRVKKNESAHLNNGRHPYNQNSLVTLTNVHMDDWYNLLICALYIVSVMCICTSFKFQIDQLLGSDYQHFKH